MRVASPETLKQGSFDILPRPNARSIAKRSTFASTRGSVANLCAHELGASGR